MYSGIVQPGSVHKTEKNGDILRLELDIGPHAEEAKIDDSVSINGVCLTVVKKNGTTLEFDAMPETQRKTNIGSLSAGERVNVELSLRLADRLGGHFVMGHVDGTGKIEKREEQGGDVKIWISAPQELTKQMITKGSVALDGVSMTLVDVEAERFSVCVIPHTLSLTTLGTKREGDTLNIEIDMLGKFIRKHLEDMNA